MRRVAGCEAHVACRVCDVPDDSPLAALGDCPPAAALAPIAAPSGITWGEALEAAVSRPAVFTLEHIPKRFRVRVAELLRDHLLAHVEAEKLATRGAADAHGWALAAARLLWLGPTLLLRAWKTHPPDALAGHEPPVAARAADRAAAIRRRAQAAEAGEWHALVSEYLDDLGDADAVDARRAADPAARLASQPEVDAAAYTRAAAKAAGHALRSAADILMGPVLAPLTEETALEVDRLISEGVQAGETDDLRREVRMALAAAPADSGVRHRHLRRRLRGC